MDTRTIMKAIAVDLHTPSQSQPAHAVQSRVGRVAASTARGLRIELGDTQVLAKQAASCLIRPFRNDQVLVAGLDDGRWYVLSILERADESSTVLELRGSASVTSDDGSLRLSGKDAVEIQSPNRVSVSTDRVSVRARGAELLLDGLEYLGKRVTLDIAGVSSRIGTLETTANRISQWARQVHRTVEGTERLRAGQLDFRARKHLRMQAKNAVLTALSLVKVDGKQIHMG